MSDLCMYELEDNVWDEFGESGDHIVPRPGDEDGNKCTVQGDRCKKSRHGVTNVTDSANNATKNEMMTKNETMLGKGSWSQTPDDVLPCSSVGESIEELSGVTINNSRMPGHCLKGDNIGSEFCGNDPILADCKRNSYDYPLSHVSQTDNELSFYDNDGEDKASSDILDYEWPDIGNFEDVDRMFRSCDSTFGLGSLSKNEELCWFPPSHATEGPEEAMKSGFNLPFPESSVMKNVCEQNSTGSLINNSDRKNVSMSDNVSCQTTDADDLAASAHIQFVSELDAKSENRSQPVHKGQISLQRKQSKHHGRPDGKRKNCYSENVGSFHHSSDLKQFGEVKHPFEDSSKSNQLFPPTDTGLRKQNMRKHAPYLNFDFSNPSDQVSVPSLSGTKSEHNSHSSLKEPSYASIRVSAQKQKHQSENGHGESTCVSSVSGEVSPQATSFRQLQQVVGQLDIRTKMCIRDSLYRLARSAEQRHSYLNPSDVNGALVADEINKCNGFMDIETNTNPIDRSIAHLLFHRPQDPSVMPANEASPLKSHSMVHESLSSPPMMSEKQIFEEIATGTDNELVRDSGK